MVAVDIYSKPLKLPSTGTIHVVSFLNKNSSDSIKRWTDLLPLKKLENSQVQFINIVFPGGLFFMIPRSKALSKIRKTISREIALFQKDWSQEEESNYQNLNIYWVVDFKRKLFKSYDLNSKYSYLFLINTEGKLLKKIRQDDYDQISNFLEILMNEIDKTSLTLED